MRVESYDEVLLGEVVQAFTDARDDVLAEAQRIASQRSRTGRFEASLEASQVVELEGRLVARVGSSLVSAKAKERGAYIVPKNEPVLTFRVGGRWRRAQAVRLPAYPVVTPAARRFAEFMAQRLREQRR